jgi:hypothetical protein
MQNLTKFEYAVLEKLLRGDHPILVELYGQLSTCNVRDREMSGIGFFTYLKVPSELKKTNINLRFGDVIAEIPELKNGAGFVLYVKNGKLEMLEGYCYDESWPNEISTFKLMYITGKTRDLTALEKSLKQ